VPRRLGVSLALALLLGVTLVPKLVSAGRTAQPDDARLARDMVAMLRAAGFRAIAVPHHLFDYALARKGDCRLMAANAPAAGYLRTRFAEAAGPVGPTLYHYRGPRLGGFPRFRPVVEEYLQHWAYRLGFVVPRTPVIGVAASPGCRPDSLAWSSLRVWPAPFEAPGFYRTAPARAARASR